MPIRLIDTDERLEVEIELTDDAGEQTSDAATFCYRRMPADVRARLLRESTTKGVLDLWKFQLSALTWGLLGWDDRVTGRGGEPIKFDVYLARLLPDAVVQKLLAKIVPGELTSSEAKVDPLRPSPSTGTPS